MDQTAIFGPFFAMLILTILVWVYMFSKRIPFIQNTDFGGPPTAEALHRLSPPEVSSPSDNLKNLFELPVMFYAMVLYLFVTNSVDALFLYLAWGYVALRTAHSIVHCTFNHVMTRFVVYALSCLVLFTMILRGMLSG